MPNKYVFKLRRGTRFVDENGATLLNEDGTAVRDDWAEYTAKEDHVDPMESELVLEYEVNPSTGKKTPRLKIGDGVSTFAELEYISVDSFILPKQVATTIYADKWLMADDNYNLIDENGNLIDEDGNVTEENYYSINEDGNFVDENGGIVKIRYAQHVDITNAAITANSKIDLNPTQEMLAVFHSKDLAFVTENDGGEVWVYCVGQKPANTYTIPCTVTEVVVSG